MATGSRLRILSWQPFVQTLRTRMPFRYGIATLTQLPHLMVRIELECDGKRAFGWAADGLPPKWFTKDPETSPQDEIAEMLHVIRHAFEVALAVKDAATPFDLWQQVYSEQIRWAEAARIPPLLANFGTSFVERAMLDAFCRVCRQPFARLVRSDALGATFDGLPAEPRRSMVVRHTIGLSDPLTDGEIAANDRLDDGLPQSLEASVRAYGLTHFKIKLSGDVAFDRDRLAAVTQLLARVAPAHRYSIDGNENFRSVEPLMEVIQGIDHARLLFVEQPLHREVALSQPVPRDVPIIIDESDATLDSLRRALSLGYAGTSHKNCKGIFKGLRNAALIATTPGAILSGEDLSTVGPVSLLQDLAVLATLGVEHAERNGHHYFRGLSAFPPRVQDQVIAAHSDLYHRHETGGFAAVTINGGRISTASVVDAPFGVGFDLDPADLTPLADAGDLS
jgi:L-alanine-DL-glutamate epimerase-like enolase superfamily enzyme